MSLQALDKKSTSSGIAEPYARQKLKARTGGEKGRHLWPRLVQNLENRCVRRKKMLQYAAVHVYFFRASHWNSVTTSNLAHGRLKAMNIQRLAAYWCLVPVLLIVFMPQWS